MCEHGRISYETSKLNLFSLLKINFDQFVCCVKSANRMWAIICPDKKRGHPPALTCLMISELINAFLIVDVALSF